MWLSFPRRRLADRFLQTILTKWFRKQGAVISYVLVRQSRTAVAGHQYDWVEKVLVTKGANDGQALLSRHDHIDKDDISWSKGLLS